MVVLIYKSNRPNIVWFYQHNKLMQDVERMQEKLVNHKLERSIYYPKLLQPN